VRIGIIEPTENAANAPGSYQLMTEEMDRIQHRLCYLESPQQNLSRYEGKLVRIVGTERWRAGERYPVVAVERVEIVW
jgi:hypothetical protein